MWNDKLWLSLGTVSLFLFNFLAFPHCTRPFYPWRDEILESKLNPGIEGKDASYYRFNVMYWYFGAKRTQKQLSGCCRSSWQTNKSLAVQWSCTCPKPIHPSVCFFLFLKATCILHPAPSRRSACIESVCLAYKEKKQRYQSAATVLLLQTPPHFGGEAGIIGGIYNKSSIYS